MAALGILFPSDEEDFVLVGEFGPLFAMTSICRGVWFEKRGRSCARVLSVMD